MKGVIEEHVVFPNFDGKKLWGVLSLPEGDTKSPVLLVCHGFSESKSRRKFVEMARFLARAGFATFRFDFSGCGESEGRLQEMSIEREVADLEVAYNFLVKERGIDETRVAILGHSLGALIGVLFQARLKKAKALALASPALAQRRLIRQWFGTKELRLWKKEGYLDTPKGRVGLRYLIEAESRNWLEVVSRIEVPTLVIHGEKDEEIPERFAREVFQLLGSPDKEMRIIENAYHSLESRGARIALTLFILEWLRRYLGEKG